MSAGTSTSLVLVTSAFAVSFLATMLAFWSFENMRPAWGAYNMVIALVGLATFVAVRARADKG